MIYIRDGSVILNLAYDDEIVQEANNTYQLSFKFPTENDTWQLLKEETVLVADDLHGEQYFSIFELEKQQGYIQVYANQFASLLNHYSISSLHVHDATGGTVMSALAGAVVRSHPFSFFSDITSRHTLNLSHKSVMEVLSKDKHSIIGQWGGDLVRDKYQVNLLKNGGSENESLFMYKKNLSNYKERSSTKSLKTRIHFHKTIDSKKEGESKQELHITVDSPLINKYRNIYEADVEVNDQDVTDLESLKRYGQQYYSTTLCDIAEDSIEIGVVGASDVPVKMFDVVSVYHEKYDVDLRLKISKYRFSPMSKKLKSIGFGAVTRSLSDIINQSINESLAESEYKITDDFAKRLEKEIDNANRAFDQKESQLREKITDGIEEAKSKAEVVKADIAAGIDQKINDSKSELANQLHRDFERSLGADRAKLVQLEGNQAEARRLLDQHKQETATKIEEAKASVSRVQAEFNQSKQNWNATTAELNRAKSELEAVKGAQSTFKQSTEQNLAQLTNKVDGKVDQATLNHTANEIKASVATLRTGLDDKVSIAAFNLKSGQIETSVQALSNAKADKTLVTQTEDRLRERIESMQVGGRNLIRGSKIMKIASGRWDNASFRKSGIGTIQTVDVGNSPVHGVTKAVRMTSGNARDQIGFTQDSYSIIPGQYTFSCWVKGTAGQKIRLQAWWMNDNAGIGPEITLKNSEWTRLSFTGNRTSGGGVSIGYVYLIQGAVGSYVDVLAPKLEQGTIMTDWTQAPEDDEEQFTNFVNESTRTAQETRQELKRFNDSVSGQITSVETQIRTTADGIRTEIIQLRQSGDTLSRKVATVEETASGLTRKIEALQIGSVNLVRNSKINESSNVYGFGKRTVSLVAGKTYWFLARAKKTGGVADKMARIYLYFPNWSQEVNLTFHSTEYEIQSTKFIPKNTGIHEILSYWYPNGGERTGQADIDWYMVVESDLPPTQWSPHPEDSEDFATRKLAEYKQTVDQNLAQLTSQVDDKVAISRFSQKTGEIETTVSRLSGTVDTKADKSALRQTENTILASVSSVQSQLGTKANQTDLDRANHQIASKANQTDLDNTNKQVATKVNKSELEVTANQIRQTVANFETTTQNKLDEKANRSELTQTATEIRQTVTSLNNDALKKAEVTIGNGVVSFGAGKTINGSTLSSMMVAEPESIQAITSKFVIQPRNENLVLDEYKGTCINISETKAVSVAFSDVAELLISFDSRRISGTGSVYFLVKATTRTGGSVWTGTTFAIIDGNKAHQSLALKINVPTNETIESMTVYANSTNHSSWEICQLDIRAKKSAELLVDGTVTSRHIASDSIGTGQLRSGAVTTEILGANAVTSDKLKVDLALINKLTADDAFFKVLTAKQAFITAVQSVDISATHVKSGLLTSRNGAARFNLDSGQLDFFHNAPSINFNSDTAALRRVHSGLPNQFIKFTSSDSRTGCTVIGSNRGGTEDVNNDQFVGLRIFNGGVDKIDIIGDIVRLASSPSVRPDGWVFNTQPNQMRIYPYLQSDYPSSRLTIGDINLYTSSSRGYSLLDVLRKFDIMFAHLGNHTGRHDVFRKVGI